jgi:hypothetical protein
MFYARVMTWTLVIAVFFLTPALADLTNVAVYVADKHFREGRYAEARQGFRDALKVNPGNEKAWEGYDKCVIKINELESSPNRVVREPRFEIIFDSVQYHDVEKFKRRYISMTGKVKNSADIPFRNVKVTLSLINDEGKEVDSRITHIDEILPRHEVAFKFQSIVNHFSEYRVSAGL